MEAIYELVDLLEKVRSDKANCKETMKIVIRSETFFRRYRRTIAALQAKYDTLNEMERMLEERLKKLYFLVELH